MPETGQGRLAGWTMISEMLKLDGLG